ncbi:Uncharacterized protein OS=Planctomyces limnophilus (strain ATCC 43296 / DSM 3776 / IFAM 1008 / 290) GN=Plim_3266 PE=4 SV=1 [Gemmataceae bacterium]|nr:Uncharacterized protein OS=Planctomyces limnophilus (strain ATCC 43296 / DSM 3776 / IFAM 1008 / 290) GN=Plim_3266 PE=4 SV=1 [Gemmataceae bacterium]VTT99543.1 Uncharacterized protein OS=Planctomyces limnophilus (strain ATCC 43296 / DSM 3776 / IFAM 1008 / 290) GN=Plim_3266 PE=4 SV=1 [Gemmataceae bacterium]
MLPSEPNRRDFTKLAAAALGGLVAGTAIAQEKKDDKKDKKNPLLSDKHVCRGLNTCKGKGAGGKNDCAGMGSCATAKAHECATLNECRGQGGCGEKPGENECKGMGKCAVPLKDKAWTAARKRFEELAKKENIKVGPAPKK